MMKRIFTILIYVLFSSVVHSQDVRVTSAFDSTRIYPGDQVHFTVTVEKPASWHLIVPLLKDTLTNHIEILNGPLSDTTVLNDGRIRILQRYLVTSFDSGFYHVPPVYAELKTDNGIKRFYSDYAPLSVMRVRIAPADTASKIFDIIKPYRAPVTAGEILPWLLLLIATAVIVWYIIRLVRKMRMKKGGEAIEYVNPDPAHIIALRELEKLKEEQLWQKGEVKLYYTRLSEIVRQYLENRFRIQSLELTTPETLSLLQKTGFRDDELFRKLRTILTGADLVKFAKYNPDGSENDLHYDYSWDFVSLTRAVEQPVEDGDVKQEKKEGK
jgi:hypothetical protein